MSTETVGLPVESKEILTKFVDSLNEKIGLGVLGIVLLDCGDENGGGEIFILTTDITGEEKEIIRFFKELNTK